MCGIASDRLTASDATFTMICVVLSAKVRPSASLCGRASSSADEDRRSYLLPICLAKRPGFCKTDSYLSSVSFQSYVALCVEPYGHFNSRSGYDLLCFRERARDGCRLCDYVNDFVSVTHFTDKIICERVCVSRAQLP